MKSSKINTKSVVLSSFREALYIIFNEIRLSFGNTIDGKDIVCPLARDFAIDIG